MVFFVTTELEITDFTPPYRLVSRSTEGIRSRTTWDLQPTEDGTRVSFIGEYRLPFGLRLLGDRAVEEIVGAQVRASLANLRRFFPSIEPKC